jgi:hypothetical protein
MLYPERVFAKNRETVGTEPSQVRGAASARRIAGHSTTRF